MKVKDILNKKYYFLDSQQELPKLDLEILISHSIKKDRVFVLSNQDYEFSNDELNLLNKHIERRKNYKPIAYVIGKKEFYGYDFFINKHTLIPRPETELLIDETLKVIKKIKSPEIQILEIGTGSGCIPISIVLESAQLYPNKEIVVDTIDISKEALKVAQKNINAYHLSNNINTFNLNVCAKNFTQKLPHPTYDIIISNPPYIPSNDINGLQPDVKDFEPIKALDGGKDGLKFYKCTIENTKKFNADSTIYLFELHSGFSKENIKSLTNLTKKRNRIIKDLASKQRILILTK